MNWTLERTRALRECLAAGLDRYEIAKRLGVNIHSLNAKLRHIRNGSETRHETAEHIVALWLEGHSLRRISRRLGLPQSTVRNVVWRLGMLNAPRTPIQEPIRNRWRPEHDAELQRLNAQGLSFLEIARRLGFHHSTVQKRARHLGLCPHSIWTDDKTEQLRQLVAIGLSTKQIAKQLGVTKNSVVGKIYRLGLSLGRRAPKKSPKYAIDGITDLPEERDEDAVPFLKLRDDQCRWPKYGDGLDMYCCGKSVVKGSRYCEEHNGRSAQNNRS